MEHVSQGSFNNHNIAYVFLDAGSKRVVIFCHGYRGSSIGPSRFFVRAARKLGDAGISSVRFDQYGSGNSGGEFLNSSFNDWIKTTSTVVDTYIKKGYRVALFGQSMGASTVICVGADVPNLSAIVAWTPDTNVQAFNPPTSGLIEESGQIVKSSYWQEAHDAHVADKLKQAKPAMYIVQCSDDEYVSEENHRAVVENAQPQHIVEMFKGYKHSAWTYEQASEIIDKSVGFIRNFLI